MENNLPTTWEEVCQVQGIDPTNLPDVSVYPKQHQAAAGAQFKIWHTVEALNTDSETKKLWIPDWTNYNESKYYNWWDMDAEGETSGFAFYITGYDGDYANSIVGSRLVFRTRDIAKHAGKHFIDLYREVMVLPK